MAEHLEPWEAVLLGIVQGATEWLPISSSGHLVFARTLFGIEVPILFDLLVHVATLVVVVVYYRVVLRDIVASLLSLPGDARRQGMGRALWQHPDRRLATLLVVGTLPIVIVGVLFETHVESLFLGPLPAAVLLILTGFWLYGTRFVDADRAPRDLRARDGLWVGVAQALAVAPGISRSGMTLGAATYLGLDRETAARYSFLLAIPAILGATIFEARDVTWDDAHGAWGTYVLGMLSAAVVGYATLAWLVRVTTQGHLHRFAPYCWVVGGAFVVHAVWA